jgi:hypothetical protein
MRERALLGSVATHRATTYRDAARPRARRRAWLARLAFALAALACASAQALDYTPHGTQPGLQSALEDPTGCSSCHRGATPATLPFMPHSSWSGSMMANATRDPLFWAALDVANHDAAGIGKAGVGDYCLRCHTPRGWLNGRVVKDTGGSPTAADGEKGCRLLGSYAEREGKSNDYGGVDCHFCHRLMPTGPQGEAVAIGNGNVWVDDALNCTLADGSTYAGPCRRGPYRYAEDDPREPPHGHVYSSYHKDSALCGSCHDVTTPDTDEGPLRTLIRADGSDSGRPFPIERTYTEWKRSLFAEAIFRDGLGDAAPGTPSLAKAQQCQDCHMPSSSSAEAAACRQNPAGSRTGDLPVHEFAGANTWVPAIIQGEYVALIGSSRLGDYDRTIAAAQAMLHSSAEVSAAITAYQPPGGAGAGSLGVRVEVTNRSGHKLPTGYAEGRRLWLNVQVRDANDQLVAESGAYDAAGAILSEDPQARVYEALQGIWNATTQACEIERDGKKQFHFVLNNCVAKDNRIPPLGFRPKAADDPDGEEAAPVGHAYPETSPGSGVLVNVDRADYVFPLAAGAAPPFSATATLYYQTSSRDYIEFLRDQAVANATPGENAMCSGSPERPFTSGPQQRSRGEFVYQLWANASDDPEQRGYGKSPPAMVAGAVASTSKERRP